MTRFDDEVVRNTAAEFVAAKLAEREERIRRAGQSRYLVEPNVKDGKGGLRDLHTLFWIAKYVYRVRDTGRADQARRVRQAANTSSSAAARISSGRCAATCISSPAAPRSGCRSTSSARSRCGSATPRIRACSDVERFMKHYFLIAKDVGDLTAILCAELEDSHAKSVPVLSRVMARFRPVKRTQLAESDDFLVDNNRITLAAATSSGATRST